MKFFILLLTLLTMYIPAAYAVNLADPGADAIVVWDDDDDPEEEFALIGTGLAFDGSTLSVDAILAEYAGVNPTAAGLSILDDADVAAILVTLGLTVGSDVQAYAANLDEYAAVNPTAAALSILDDATVAAILKTLGANHGSIIRIFLLMGAILSGFGTFFGTMAGIISAKAVRQSRSVLTVSNSGSLSSWLSLLYARG